MSKKPSAFQKLFQKIGIDETYTKPIIYDFPKVKNQVYPENGYNYEADLLMLPTTKKGYSYLLVVVDIYSNYLDFEPLKTKSAEDVLKAFKIIFKRGIITEPKASIRTDSGSEFKSVVDKYLYNHNILHLWSIPDRHKQMGNAENANKQLGRILMTYLANQSEKLDKDYNEWTDIIDVVRHGLNDMKKHPKDVDMRTFEPKDINIDNLPLYKVGDLVYRRLEKATNRFGDKLHNTNFRAGDLRFQTKEPRKIVQVLAYTSKNPWRYILYDLPNVSYAEAELKPAKETEEKFIVKEIVDKRKVKGKTEYLVHWKGKKKVDWTWEPKEQLLEDGLDEYIQKYEDS